MSPVAAVATAAETKPQNNGHARTFLQTVGVIRSTFAGNTAALDKRLRALYSTYRLIRKDPTIAFARALAAAPIVAAEWIVESDDGVPPEIAAFIESNVLPHRQGFLEAAATFGNIDYGWCPFEKVFDYINWNGRTMLGLVRLKPLLVDITDVLVVDPTGEFAGFRQSWPFSGRALPGDSDTYRAGFLILDPAYALLIAFRVEADNYYGEGLLENARRTYAWWEDANDGAARYDTKVAGSIWVVHYPTGTSVVNGVEKDNYTIATEILDGLMASGGVVVPREINRALELLRASSASPWAWEIELKDHSAKQPTFIDRLAYLDKLKVRAVLIPERGALEGEYGTKADASVHASLALSIRETEHRSITAQVNAHLVDQLVAYNFGREWAGKVRIVPSPLEDAKLAYFQTLYSAAMANPASAAEASGLLDLPALADAIGIPRREADDAGEAGGSESEIGDMLTRLYEQTVGVTEDQPAAEPAAVA